MNVKEIGDLIILSSQAILLVTDKGNRIDKNWQLDVKGTLISLDGSLSKELEYYIQKVNNNLMVVRSVYMEGIDFHSHISPQHYIELEEDLKEMLLSEDIEGRVLAFTMVQAKYKDEWRKQ